LRGLFIAVVSIFFVIGIVSLLTGGAFFGHVLPTAWPFWIVLCTWIYLFTLAIHILKHHSFIEFLGMLAAWIVAGWAVWHFVPASHPYFLAAKDWLASLDAKYNNR
jgi:hypothetical protein